MSGFLMDVCVLSLFSRVQLFVTPWIVARQAPLSMGFSRHKYWNGVPFPGPLPDPRIKPAPLMSPALAGGFFTTSATVLKAVMLIYKTSTEGFQAMVETSLPSPQAGQGSWRKEYGEYE